MRTVEVAGRINKFSTLYDKLGILFLPASGIALMLVFAPIGGSLYDMRYFYLPWMDAVQHGGISSISGGFSDYSPTFIYMMYLARGLIPFVGKVASIKFIEAPFVLLMSLGVYGIVFSVTHNRDRSLLAAGLLWITPTIQVNSFLWGQADATYTAFAVLFLLFACTRQTLLASIMFGISLAFKAQAIFLSPLLLYLLLSGQMPLYELAAIPLAYATMMIPAAVAGRPWTELLMVYSKQGGELNVLAMSAPNPWTLIDRMKLVSYKEGLVVGILLAGVASLGTAILSMRLRVCPLNNVIVAALTAALVPFFLPKMHDRYFFLADVLSIVLAMCMPRYWIAAVLMQVGSLCAYMAYFNLSSRGAPIGAFFVSAALGVFALAFAEAQRQDFGIAGFWNGKSRRRWRATHVLWPKESQGEEDRTPR